MSGWPCVLCVATYRENNVGPLQNTWLINASELIIIFYTALRKANNSSSWVGQTHRKWVRQTLLAISLHLLDRLKAEKRLNLIEFEMPSNWTCNMFDWCINKTMFKFCPNVLILQMFWINYLKSQRTKWITKTLMVCTVCSVLSNWDLFIKLRAALLSPYFIHQKRKVALT